jgi:hypothetical protein
VRDDDVASARTVVPIATAVDIVVDRLIDRLEDDASTLGALIVADLRREVAAYRGLGGDELELFSAATTQATELFVGLLRSGGSLPDGSIAHIEAVGAERAALGDPFDAIVESFAVARRRAWRHVLELAESFPASPALVGAVGEITSRLSDVIDATSGAIARGYHARRGSDLAVAAHAHVRLVDDVLRGAGDDGELVTRGRELGLDLRRPLGLVLLAPHRVSERGTFSGAAQALLAELPSCLDGSSRLDPGPHAVILVPSSVWTRACARAQELASQHTTVAMTVEPQHITSLAATYERAARLVATASKVASTAGVLAGTELAVCRLLSTMPSEDAASLVHDTLGPILTLGDRQRDRCLETLWAIYESGGDLAQAAQRSCLSVRGMQSRVARLRERTGIALERTDEAVGVALALHAHRLLTNTR